MRAVLRPGVCSVLLCDDGTGTAVARASLRLCGLPAERLEIIDVAEASQPGPAAAGSAGPGPAAVRNAAAARAFGQYLVFLSGSVGLPEGALALLVGVLDREPGIAGVGAVGAPDRASDPPAGPPLAPDHALLRFLGGDTPGGAAPKPEAPAPAPALTPDRSASQPTPRDRPVLWLGADLLVVRTAAYDDVGGFDEALAWPAAQAAYGWALNLRGHRLRSRSVAIALPAVEPVAPADVIRLCQRYLSDDALRRLGPALVAAAEAPHAGAPNPVSAPAEPAARARVQASRRVSDAVLLPMVRAALDPRLDPAALAAYDGVDLAAGRYRILVVTGDTLGARMAGPAIRSWEIAHALAAEPPRHHVVLGALGACTVTSPTVDCRTVGESELRELERWADVIVFQGFLPQAHPWLMDSDRVLVADLYDPLHLETLEQEKHHPMAHRGASLRNSVRALDIQLRRADFFLCASAKQRDLWLGALGGLGRLNPLTYDGDENLAGLLAVVPFGIAAEPPHHDRDVIKGVVPGIGVDDQVILWGGGIYNWFDPLTLIRAVELLRSTHPNARLYFLGTKHPNPLVPAMQMASAARELADVRGLTGSAVFFNEDWVPYDERQNYLLEAGIGVSCHFDHVETAFSFRTRILDYLWAGLPIVTTRGDTFADLVARHGLGEVVDPEDVEGLAAALARLLDDRSYADRCRAHVAEVAPAFVWRGALAPLLEFCRAPHHAADRGGAQWPDATAGLPKPPRTLGSEWALARDYLRRGGPREVGRRALGRLLKRFVPAAPDASIRP